MIPRKTKRRFALAAAGVFLLVAVAFLIPCVVLLLDVLHGKTADNPDGAKMGLAICSLASAAGVAGFIQWLRVATGRVKIRWSWNDHEKTSVDD